MGLSYKMFVLLLIFYALDVAKCTTPLHAVFSMDGIQGNVSFTQSAPGSSVTIGFKLAGLPAGSTYSFKIYDFPTNYDTAERCSDLGSVFADLSDLGNISPSNQDSATFSVNNLELSGASSISGRSLLLVNSVDASKKACATIRPWGIKMTMAVVKLPGPVGGTVILYQPAGNADAETWVYSDLFYVDTTSSATNDNTLKILSNQVLADVSEEKSVADRCSGLGSVFNPSSSSEAGCAQNDQSKCAIGNLATKMGNVGVALTKGALRKFIIDTNLPLSGANSVVGKSLAVYAGNTILACANVREVKPKSVSAIFNMHKMTGSIKFDQDSPFDPTTVTVNFQSLQNIAGNYHVHNYPMIPKMMKEYSQCSADAVGGHWNPFGVVVANSPAVGTGTDDQYEIGDLSGKYGTLTGMTNMPETVYTDWNLPLFGVNSIVGRSVVIHKNEARTPRWVCANIEYPAEVKTAAAKFTYPVVGSIILRQDKTDPLSDTSVFIQLAHADGSDSSSNHNWHVHIKKTMADFSSDDQRCVMNKGHYNPFNVDLQGSYSSECKSTNHLRCELGDSSAKTGKVDIGGSDGSWKKHFGTDTYLPLSGPQSVIGRSIVIHVANAGAPRLACTDIMEQRPIKAMVETWTDGGPTGSISFTQKSLYDWTTVDVDIKSLGNQAGGYHVHKLPVPESQSCSNAAVQGHFNPFQIEVANSPDAGKGSMDEYEVGDLSGKYGMMSNLQSIKVKKLDNNLPLMGPQSIVGRSMVIHRSDDTKSRWVCGTILEDLTSMGGTRVSATAKFEKGDIHGFVKLSQVVFSDGSGSDTTIEVNLYYASNSSKVTPDHNWHVHVKPVGSDATADSGRCMSCEGHYNPFLSNVTGTYKNDCKFENPWRCELGDVSAKQEKYSIGSGRKLYNDVNVPLSGNFSVIGRSIVFHTENAGAPRVACATIVKDPVISPGGKEPQPSLASFHVASFWCLFAAALSAKLFVS